MASNSQDTCIDADLHARVSNYDEQFGQLLQAICDNASEDVLRARLDSTLRSITDMLARGRVYEKALGEARHRPRIEKFLVMELEKDAKITAHLSLNLPKVRRLKIACWAAKWNFVHMVMALIHCRNEGDGALSPEGYWALHWAAKMEHAEVVNAILRNKDLNAAVLMSVEKSLIDHRLSNGFDTPFDCSDGSGIGPFYKVSFTPLQLASLYGHTSVVELLEERLIATIEDDTGVQTLEIATEMRRDEILKILTDTPEIEKDLKRLYTKRKEHVDAANTILIVAALIATVTFAGWLTPPLGYSPFFGSASLDAGAPTPSGMYPSFISVEGHPTIKIFWAFNSLSFFFAITALLVGVTVARPINEETAIRREVLSLRAQLVQAYSVLILSVVFAIGAFISAGFVVLPPIPSYTAVMAVTVGIGMTYVVTQLRRLITSVPFARTVSKFLGVD